MPSLSRFLFPSWIQSLGFGPWGPERWEEPTSTGYDILFFLTVIPLHKWTLLSILPLFTRLGSGPLRPPAGWGDSIHPFNRQRGQGLRMQTWHVFLSPFCSPNEDAEVAGTSWRSDEERWKTLMHGLYPRKVRELSFAVTSYTNLTTLHSGGGGNLLHKTNPWDNTKKFCYAHSGNRISVPENY